MQLQACLRCDKKLAFSKMRYTEGCWLCDECWEYIQKNYENDLAREFNHFKERCKGCD